MPKSAVRIIIDTPPATRNGELTGAATVVQVSQLAMTAPFSGDFQIIDNGRLIVGENVEWGGRVVIGQYGTFGYDRDGVNTFAVMSQSYGNLGAGDVFAGYASGNYLLFDQSEGTLGVYSPAGAGFIAAADGSLYAGDTDGAHMRWNTANRSLEVRNGDDVKISLDANGDGFFDGAVYASAGNIYGPMQVDGLLRVGDVDGPSVSLGKFQRNTDAGLVESGEILVLDTNNLPWFHVVAGGGTAGGGWFHLGSPGDYSQRLTYDGADLTFDGMLYARGGEFTGNVQVTTGSISTNSVQIAQNGIVFDAILGRFDGAGLHWKTATGSEKLCIGTLVDLGDITGVVIESTDTALNLLGPSIVLQATTLSMDGTQIGMYTATPITRPTTSHGAASFTANSGTAVNDASTFDGYTLKQVVKALRDIGVLT